MPAGASDGLNFPAERPVPLEELVALVGQRVDILGEVSGLVVGAVAPAHCAASGALSFVMGGAAKTLALLQSAPLPKRCVLAVGLSAAQAEPLAASGATIICARNPRLWFIEAVRHLFPGADKPGHSISEQASVAPGAEVGGECYVGPFAVIDRGARVGAGSTIHPGVHIGRNVVLGRKVIVQSSSVVGAIGQSSEKNAAGQHISLPHLGAVVIGDESRIGANTTIIRGSLQNTRIGARCSIGNQVNVGHNCEIGDDAFISAGSVLCGSCKVGQGCWIAPGVIILNKVRIGNQAMIGLGTIVRHDVEAGQFVAGDPPRVLRKLNRYNE